jgi:hypothetical protein
VPDVFHVVLSIMSGVSRFSPLTPGADHRNAAFRSHRSF